MANECSDGEIPEMLRHWLLQAVEAGASDLHLVSGYAPTLRLNGGLRRLDSAPISEPELRALLMPPVVKVAADAFLAEKNVDFAVQLQVNIAIQRFRTNYFLSGQTMGVCFRVIPAKIPDFAWAGFPAELATRLVHFRDGRYNARHETATVQAADAADRNCAVQHSDGLGRLPA